MCPFLSAEKNGTAVAAAEDLACLWIEQMLVSRQKLSAAELSIQPPSADAQTS